jgi:hypothetical protein
MNERIPGPDVMTAFSAAIDDGVSSYRMAIFYLGVSAGQCFSRGWSSEDLDKEITNLAISHPRLAADIRKELCGVVGCPADERDRK